MQASSSTTGIGHGKMVVRTKTGSMNKDCIHENGTTVSGKFAQFGLGKDLKA